MTTLKLSCLLPGADALHIFEISEELGAGIEHHHIVSVLEAGAICFETTVELVKLGTLSKCLGINLRSLGIARATDFFSIAVSFSQNDDTLPIGIGTNLF